VTVFGWALLAGTAFLVLALAALFAPLLWRLHRGLRSLRRR
jgi:hypothetical protein